MSQPQPERLLGQQGEELATRYLERKGYAIVARNVTLSIGRTRQGSPHTAELDIVAFDGDTLVFIEVKTRTSQDLAAPEAAITPTKQRQLIKAAQRYRRLIGPCEAPYRFDVVSIVWPLGETPHIRLYKDFFSPEKK